MDNTVQNDRRRWLRFSLRAFFVFITLVACAGGWIGYQLTQCPEEQQAIAHLLESMDGRNSTILFANVYADQSSHEIQPGLPIALFEQAPRWSARLLGTDITLRVVSYRNAPRGNRFSYERDESGRLRRIREFEIGLDDEDMLWINRFHHLRFLMLSWNRVTDNGLIQLDNLPHLETLWLSHTPVTDAGLTVLSHFPQLRELDLEETEVSDGAIEVLTGCREVRKLKLIGTDITPEGIKRLQQALPNCKIEH
jgi:hypothetical protein